MKNNSYNSYKRKLSTEQLKSFKDVYDIKYPDGTKGELTAFCVVITTPKE
jgi:hypothetical protein